MFVVTHILARLTWVIGKSTEVVGCEARRKIFWSVAVWEVRVVARGMKGVVVVVVVRTRHRLLLYHVGQRLRRLIPGVKT